MSSKGTLIVMSAPSGSGKTSLADRLVAELPGIEFSVSHTTRAPRQGEAAGRDYFFVSAGEFEKLIAQEAFLEYAHVYGNYYGTAVAFVDERLAAGRDVLLDIDVQGALKVRARRPDALMIFVFPPSFEVLERRLRSRGLDDERVIRKRLAIAREEIRNYQEYQYVVVNDDLDRSLTELKSIIIAARCEVQKRNEQAEKIVSTFWEKEDP